MAGLTLKFLGAAGTVTGSRYLLETGGHRLVLDCGLFQGRRKLRRRNREDWGFDPLGVDAVCLTHAHLDHSGLVPRLALGGYDGPVHASAATADLCGLLWPDSGYLQEEEAAYQSRRRHQTIEPLYDREQAEAALGLLRPQPYGTPLAIGPFRINWRPVGHILGASSLAVEACGRRIVFSGDVGRPADPLMRPPQPLGDCDYLVVESTYGIRSHTKSDLQADLGRVIAETAARGGMVLIPAFAVGRAQAMLHLITELKASGEIPPWLQVFLNSPMAINASEIYCRYLEEHRLTPDQCHRMCAGVTYVRSVEDSKALNTRRGPMVIIAASGMLAGGRILHHLIAFGNDHRNTIVLCGYQAEGTRGRALVSGRHRLRIFGRDRPIRAQVKELHGLSGHADANELVDWLRQSAVAPRQTYVTHGAVAARDAFADRLRGEFGWAVHGPDAGEVVQL